MIETLTLLQQQKEVTSVVVSEKFRFSLQESNFDASSIFIDYSDRPSRATGQ